MGDVLIVEDAESARHELGRIVGQRGCNVIFAKNGKEGLDKFQSHQNIDLIFADLYMPVMDGLQMCQKIRDLNVPQKPAIVIITTETNNDVKQSFKKLGVQGWLVKPFRSTAIEQLVDELIVAVK